MCEALSHEDSLKLAWGHATRWLVACPQAMQEYNIEAVCQPLCVSVHKSSKADVACVACNRWAGCIPDEEAGAFLWAGLATAGGASAAALARLEPFTPAPKSTATITH